jgi:hypothetical protein
MSDSTYIIQRERRGMVFGITADVNLLLTGLQTMEYFLYAQIGHR